MCRYTNQFLRDAWLFSSIGDCERARITLCHACHALDTRFSVRFSAVGLYCLLPSSRARLPLRDRLGQLCGKALVQSAADGNNDYKYKRSLLGYELQIHSHLEDVDLPHKIHDSAVACLKIVDKARGKFRIAP